MNNYIEMENEPDPSLWFLTYTEAIDAVEGGSGVAAFFRHLGAGGKYIYLTSEEIKTDYPDYYQRYYHEVKLPNGVGSFKSDGYERTISFLLKIWRTLYEGLFNFSLHPSQVVRNWDLDTGVDMDAGGVLTFWM